MGIWALYLSINQSYLLWAFGHFIYLSINPIYYGGYGCHFLVSGGLI